MRPSAEVPIVCSAQRHANNAKCTALPAVIAGGLLGAAGGLPVARRLANHAALARRTFAAMILAVAGYVALRATGLAGG